MREHCLQPKACVAKSDKHCRRCTITARNKTPEQRAAASREKLARPTLDHSATAKAYSPEANASRRAKGIEREIGWCPVDYRDLNKKLRLQGVCLRTRKMYIKKLVKEDTERAMQRFMRDQMAKQQRDLAQRY